MHKFLKTSLLIIFFGLGISLVLLQSCAQMASPPGGKKDTLAPVVTSSIPLNKSKNFKGQKIELNFNEYITVKSLNQELLITPTIGNYETRIRPTGLTLLLDSALKDNTTYTLEKFYHDKHALHGILYDAVFTIQSTDANAENTVFADVIDGADTLRVYAVHLQSFGFGAREYRVIDDVNAKNDSSVIQSKQLIKKMRNTFYWHGVQSDFIVNEMASSPYPTFVMGDLNDVPGSYTYSVVRGDRKDAFLGKGTGLGATFTSSSSFMLQLLPTLRIDYIFHPEQYEALQFTQGGKRLSDHSFLVSDIRKK